MGTLKLLHHSTVNWAMIATAAFLQLPDVTVCIARLAYSHKVLIPGNTVYSHKRKHKQL